MIENQTDFELLSVLSRYNSLGTLLDTAMLVDHLPNRKYKYIAKRLSILKTRGCVDAKGTKFHFHYFITAKGLEYLAVLERRETMAELLMLTQSYM
jgi:hypothetical protein